MWSVILGAVIGFLVSHQLKRKWKWTVIDTFFGGGIGFILAVSLGGIFFDSDYFEKTYYEEKLIAMKDLAGIRGDFYIGGGQIGTEFYYVYYTQDISGAIRLDQVPAEKARVYEVEGRKDGLVRKHHRVLKYRRRTGVLDKMSIYPAKLPFPLEIFEGAEFYVPKGSVVRVFNLDLE